MARVVKVDEANFNAFVMKGCELFAEWNSSRYEDDLLRMQMMAVMRMMAAMFGIEPMKMKKILVHVTRGFPKNDWVGVLVESTFQLELTDE